MPDVKIMTKLPDDDSGLNGLAVIRDALLSKPGGQHVIIALVDCGKTEITHADGGASATRIPTIRIVHVEVVPRGIRENDVRSLLDTIHRNRTRKQSTLPGLGDGSDDEVTGI